MPTSTAPSFAWTVPAAVAERGTAYRTTHPSSLTWIVPAATAGSGTQYAQANAARFDFRVPRPTQETVAAPLGWIWSVPAAGASQTAQMPRTGDVVHYVNGSLDHFPAIVLKDGDSIHGRLSLAVLGDPQVTRAFMRTIDNGAPPPDPAGVCRCLDARCFDYPHVHTLEGPLVVRTGDWIIKGVKGEFYPCKADIFHLTYEPVEGALSDVDFPEAL